MRCYSKVFFASTELGAIFAIGDGGWLRLLISLASAHRGCQVSGNDAAKIVKGRTPTYAVTHSEWFVVAPSIVFGGRHAFTKSTAKSVNR
jgi:hypothetical protein